jgi:3-oxoacyl-[acyl-carrier protein] reductase
MRLQDKVIIVTGGANGIGALYSKHFVAEGARVLIADINVDQGTELAKTLNEDATEPRALAVRVDVTSESDTLAMVQTAVETFGRVDVLINNAGIYPHVEFDDITYDHWRKVMNVNLDSIFLTCKAVLPQMKKQNRGKIINVSTDLVWVGLVGMTHYIASKAGIIGFTRSLAREVGMYNITVNSLAPGPIIPPGPLTGTSADRVAAIVGQQAIKRPQRAADLIGPMLFLCSADADFISGQVLSVDGGLTNH